MYFEAAGGCAECLEPRKTYQLIDGVCAICRGRVAPDRTDLPPPPWPTSHLPGTEGRLIILEWWAANGFGLWHPADAAEDPRGSLRTAYWPMHRDLDLPVFKVAV